MTDDTEKKNATTCSDTTSQSTSVAEEKGDVKLATKKPYTKPTLRKFSQIDYVTAYGID